VAALAAVVVICAPGAAFAHGIDGTGESAADFGWLGVKHMLLGWDHLAFIAGVVLLAGGMRRAAKLISVFALGHSTTLIAATVAGWRLDAALVDIVIALSLVFVGVVGVIGRPKAWRWFGAAVFGFGLVHGLGLATRLQDLGLPHDGLLARVIAFNVGVEIGQLVAVGAVFMLADVARHYLRRVPKPSRIAHGALITAGLIAATVLTVATVGGTTDEVRATAVADAVGDCQVRDRTEMFPSGGGHPSKDFYEPGETTPLKDLGHVMGDGWLIVQYPTSLPAGQVAQLRAFTTGKEGNRVAAGSIAEQKEPLKVVNVLTTMTCDNFDLPAVKTFAKTWFNNPRSRSPE